MGRKYWTDKETEYLTKNWGLISIELLAKELNRSKPSIKNKVNDLGLERLVKKWTNEEIEYLSKNWGLIEIKTLEKNLKRSRRAIHIKASSLKLKPINKKWTNEEIEYLSKNWGSIKVDTMAEELKRSRYSIFNKANALGLEPINKKWSEEETEYLSEKWGLIKVETLEKRLKRSKATIMAKAYELGLESQRDVQGYHTISFVANACGVSDHVVRTNWIRKLGLKTKKSTFSANNHRVRLIDAEEFWEFAYKNKNVINFHKIERGVLLPEPEWLREEIQKPKKPPRSAQRWKEIEVKQLIDMVRLGYDANKIAEKLGRTIGSIEHKTLYLKNSGVLEFKRTQKQQIIEMNLIELEKKQLSDKEIAELYGCCQCTVVNARKKLRANNEYIGYKSQIRRVKNDKTIS
jgi:predicted transcriptional regulator